MLQRLYNTSTHTWNLCIILLYSVVPADVEEFVSVLVRTSMDDAGRPSDAAIAIGKERRGIINY